MYLCLFDVILLWVCGLRVEYTNLNEKLSGCRVVLVGFWGTETPWDRGREQAVVNHQGKGVAWTSWAVVTTQTRNQRCVSLLLGSGLRSAT